MPTFKVIASVTTELECNIEADSLEEAQAMARKMDGEEFKEIPGSAAWKIEGVTQIPESELAPKV